jgi:hypothetical protein
MNHIGILMNQIEAGGLRALPTPHGLPWNVDEDFGLRAAK